jgi:hypothetical protein
LESSNKESNNTKMSAFIQSANKTNKAKFVGIEKLSTPLLAHIASVSNPVYRADHTVVALGANKKLF